LLWIDAKGVSFSFQGKDAVFARNLIIGQARDIPASDDNWVTHNSNELEAITGRNISLNTSFNPLCDQLLSVRSREGTEVGNAGA